MHMLGVWVNVGTIVLGSLLGRLLGKRISQRFQTTIMQGLALCVLLIGLSGALSGSDTMGVIVSIVLGALIGEGINIEKRLQSIGDFVQHRMKDNKSNFSQGFVTASLLFCVGAMAVVGSLEAGISGNNSTLFAKSALDGVTSIMLSAAMGIGVLFSAVPILIYQGAIALLAGLLSPLLSDAVVSLMSAVGGLLIAGISFNMLDIKQIKVGNLLPAIFIPIAYVPFMNWVSTLLA